MTWKIAGVAIACLVTWYVLKLDGIVPTIVAVAVGTAIGALAERLKGA